MLDDPTRFSPAGDATERATSPLAKDTDQR
jgi:hypothetical protein